MTVVGEKFLTIPALGTPWAVHATCIHVSNFVRQPLFSDTQFRADSLSIWFVFGSPLQHVSESQSVNLFTLTGNPLIPD